MNGFVFDLVISELKEYDAYDTECPYWDYYAAPLQTLDSKQFSIIVMHLIPLSIHCAKKSLSTR